jgi:predicted ArsR family transcriptional regulator
MISHQASAADISATEIESLSDRTLVEHLRRSGPATISDLVEHAGVTATAIRQRLNRMMDEGLVQRKAERAGRGRPTHWYSLTSAGERSAGHNYEDLATVLWKEIRAVEDPDVRYGLLKRIAVRMAETYRDQIVGDDLAARMESLVGLMQERDIPFEVNMVDQLPVLTALACPYPELAEQDQSICSMEKMLFSEILGESVRLSNCRLNSEGCCTFQSTVAQPTQV